MKRKTVVTVLAMVGLMFVVNAKSTSPSKSDVSSYVDKLFAAIRQGDKDALYSLTEQAQNELSEIKDSKPEFLREKKQTEHREAWLKAFAEPQKGAPIEYFTLSLFLDLDPSVEILEVNEDKDIFDVYVRLKFKSIEKSPLLVPPNIWSEEKGAMFLKERTLQLHLTRTGRYRGFESVQAAPDIAWTNLPLQVVAVGVHYPWWDPNMICMTIGDAPLKEAATVINGYKLTQQYGNVECVQATHAIKVRFGATGNLFSGIPRNPNKELSVSIEVTDTRGQTTKASFVVSAEEASIESGDSLYVREPWRGTKLWKTRPGIRLLQNGDQSNPQQNQAPTIEKVPQSPTGSSKPSPQSSAKHDLTDVLIGNSMVSLFGDVSISVSIDGQTPVIFKSDEFSNFEMEIGSRHTVTAIFRGKKSVKNFVVTGPGTRIKFQPPDFQ